ncbi:hypothetical protein M8818_006288 [Zalaria obscura]|uniref:Uncharacterized protein n=1 Tax=Zalaria obscura TaxID=2024903 RepID=A0ACC3S7W6_9PEZI
MLSVPPTPLKGSTYSKTSHVVLPCKKLNDCSVACITRPGYFHRGHSMPSKRTRSGCWTCRDAGYKCDEGKPICGRCLRLNIDCKGYGLRLKWREYDAQAPKTTKPRTRRSSASSSAASTATDLPSPILVHTPPTTVTFFPGTPGIDNDLLRHWVLDVSPLLCVGASKGHNPFQTHLTAMAFQHEPLRHTLSYMAATHLAALSNQAIWTDLASKHQRAAISLLRRALCDPTELGSDATLATTLMMQVCARFTGDEEPTTNHLIGAKGMILSRGGPATTSSSCFRFLYDLFAYHDILFSITRGVQPYLKYDGLSSSDMGMLVGCTSDILQLVAEISCLHTWKKSASADTYSMPQAFLDSGLDLKRKLQLWTPSDANTESALSGEAYRHAAFIYLYRVLYNIGCPHPTTLMHVKLCLDSLRRIASTSSFAAAHVWPLFTAGCEAIAAEDRNFVRRRLEEMFERRKMPSLRRVLDAIEQVWVGKDAEARRGVHMMAGLDCIALIRSSGKVVEVV